MCLLYSSNKDPLWWCFALVYASLLVDICPVRSFNYMSCHECLFGCKPSIGHLCIWGSDVYLLHCHLTWSQVNQWSTLGTFLGFQGMGHVICLCDDRNCICYAHHAAIDEVCAASTIDQCSPAAKFLHGQAVNASELGRIYEAVLQLKITTD